MPNSEINSGELLMHHRREPGALITCAVKHGCVTEVVSDVRCSDCLTVLGVQPFDPTTMCHGNPELTGTDDNSCAYVEACKLRCHVRWLDGQIQHNDSWADHERAATRPQPSSEGCQWCPDGHPKPPEVCEHGLLLMGCDGCWREAHPGDQLGRATAPKASGRRQCLSCGRSGGELTENGCPSCGPAAEIGEA